MHPMELNLELRFQLRGARLKGMLLGNHRSVKEHVDQHQMSQNLSYYQFWIILEGWEVEKLEPSPSSII